MIKLNNLSRGIFVALLCIQTTLQQQVDRCPTSDEYCMSCNGNDCAQCEYSYLDFSTKICKKPSITVSNCWVYSSDGVCQVCEPKYKRNSSGKCDAINKAGCREVNSMGVCTTCDNGVMVKLGECNSNNSCMTDHCSVCTVNQYGGEMCSMCKNGYGLVLSGSSSKCVVLDSHTSNCLYLDSRYGSTQQCLICRPGYYFNKGGCVKRGMNFNFPWSSRLNLPAISFTILFLFLKF